MQTIQVGVVAMLQLHNSFSVLGEWLGIAVVRGWLLSFLTNFSEALSFVVFYLVCIPTVRERVLTTFRERN